MCAPLLFLKLRTNALDFSIQLLLRHLTDKSQGRASIRYAAVVSLALFNGLNSDYRTRKSTTLSTQSNVSDGASYVSSTTRMLLRGLPG